MSEHPVQPGEGPDETTLRVAEAAAKLLQVGGPDALSVRKVARGAGVSTMAIYSRYGSKTALLDTLSREGFEALEAALHAVHGSGAPWADLRAVARAYRAAALARPGHYRLMFGVPVSDDTARTTAGVFRHLEHRARQALAGAEVEPARLAHALLGLCHGLVHLEVVEGSPGADEATFTAAVDALLRGFGG